MVHKYPNGEYFGLGNPAHQSWLELVRPYAKNKKSGLLKEFAGIQDSYQIVFCFFWKIFFPWGRGWQVLAGIDIGPKRSFEKSILLMSKCESARLKFACVAPADMDR